MRGTLVFGNDSEEVRRKCIARGNESTFTKAKEIACTEEATQMQLKAMSNSLPPSQLQQPDGEVNAISKGKETEDRRSRGRVTRWPENKPKQCYRCGDNFHAKGQQCPATGAECYDCNKRGHFGKVCKSKTKKDAMTLQTDHSDGATSECPSYDRVFLGTLEAEQSAPLNCSPSSPMTPGIEQRKNSTKVMTEIQVTVNPSETHTVPINCKVDTGVISKEQYDKLTSSPQHRHLGPAQYRSTAYGGHTIKTLGTCQLYINQKGSIKEITFNVTEVPGPAMLGCKACEDLGLIKFNCTLETSEQDKATYLETQATSKSQQKVDGSGPKSLKLKHSPH